jgi:branched-chain amino acid transport system ATP-binding protein
MIEQNAQLALAAAGRAYLLENGRLVKSGTTESFRSDESVRKSYLGV